MILKSDLNRSGYDPRPRKPGRKLPLTPLDEALIAANEARDAAFDAMRAAQRAFDWACYLVQRIGSEHQLEEERRQRLLAQAGAAKQQEKAT